MGKKLYPTDTLEQALNILSAWDHIGPSLTLGTITPASLSSEVDRVKALQIKIIQLQIELSNVRNQRDEACIGIWDKVKRARAGIKGIYGDDSIEYSFAGGTRLSDRKPVRRKSKAGQSSVNLQLDGKVSEEEE
jgi:hypothetical protein